MGWTCSSKNYKCVNIFGHKKLKKTYLQDHSGTAEVPGPNLKSYDEGKDRTRKITHKVRGEDTENDSDHEKDGKTGSKIILFGLNHFSVPKDWT